MQALGAESELKQVKLSDAPSDPHHALRKVDADGLYAAIGDQHAPVTKADTASVSVTVTGQQVSAAVRRKTASLASDEGAVKETADGLTVKLGGGANEAAPGNHTHTGFAAASDVTAEAAARAAADAALAAVATPTTPGMMAADMAKWLDGAQNGGANATVVAMLYIGQKARFVAVSNGTKLQVQNSGGTWVDQVTWSEA